MVTVSVAQSLSLQGGIVAGDLRHGPPLVAEPRQVLAQLDADYPMERFDRYFTIAYLLIELQTGILRTSRAGHPPALLLRRGAPLRELEAGGTIIGLGGAEFEQEELALEDGDRVFLCTDGLVDYESPSGEAFGDARLRATLARTLEVSLSRAVEELLAAIRAHGSEAPPRDDVTLLGLEWRKPLLLEVDSTLRAVRGAAARLRAHWQSAGVPEAAAQALELAFVEAATNVVVHGHRGEAGHPLLVQSAATAAGVELVLRDTGAAVPGGFAGPLRDPATLAEGGRGTFLIRSTMDSVQYSSGPEGNVLVLRKRAL
jgi:anti-sigma regulatory factor (Ser/Thr protein kinase)